MCDVSLRLNQVTSERRRVQWTLESIVGPGASVHIPLVTVPRLSASKAEVSAPDVIQSLERCHKTVMYKLRPLVGAHHSNTKIQL
jgi:hypothetical protein